jgi:hypothetical protein
MVLLPRNTPTHHIHPKIIFACIKMTKFGEIPLKIKETFDRLTFGNNEFVKQQISHFHKSYELHFYERRVELRLNP